MAAFASRELEPFLVHWQTRILGQPDVLARTIVIDGVVSGYVSSWYAEGRRLVCYWLARECWGRGVASWALTEFLERVELTRPVEAFVAVSNVASRRVLEKCGFELVPDSPAVGEDGVKEVRYRKSTSP